MKLTFEKICEELKKSGYETVRHVVTDLSGERPVLKEVDGKKKYVLTMVEEKRDDITCYPAMTIDPETKNFRCLTVMRKLGVEYADHITFVGDSILRGVKIPEQKNEQKETK